MNADTIGHPEKAARVRAMFDQIAPRYDLLNHLLSMNIDKLWRRATVRALADVIARPEAMILDLCCGTGDLSIALRRASQTSRPVYGLDFSGAMLDAASGKTPEAGSIALLQGDATRVPFADASFDAITIAFGLRNLTSVEAGLGEIHRLLKPGGRAAILEFSRPVVPVMREGFQFYFAHILPRIGGAISGSRGAYTYLPESVKLFPDQRRLQSMMESAGFVETRYQNLSLGIAALHVGEKA